jgi:hypothetical protein
MKLASVEVEMFFAARDVEGIVLNYFRKGDACRLVKRLKEPDVWGYNCDMFNLRTGKRWLSCEAWFRRIGGHSHPPRADVFREEGSGD